MLTTAKEIAKYFRESVKFNFKTEKIDSFDTIESRLDDFFTLLDRDAFSALLSDCLAYDNQLEDIFLDLFDAELGLRGFARKDARLGPRMRVAYFLGMPKYAYHENSISKVYLAINTWLVFYGEKEISAEWENCPFCGARVKDGVCTMPSCRKKSNEFIKAAATLAVMLEQEKSGSPSMTPDFWNDIKDGSEFDGEYKDAIIAIRSERDSVKRAAEQSVAKEAEDKALLELSGYEARIAAEDGRDNPAYESILDELLANQVIGEAMKHSSEAVKKRITEIKRSVTQKKKALEKRATAEREEKSFEESLTRMVELQALLEQETESYTLPYPELKRLFGEAESTHTAILTLIGKGYSITNPDIQRVIDKYDSVTRVEIAAYIREEDHKILLEEQKSALVSKIGAILSMFVGVRPRDDKAKDIKAALDNGVEENPAFNKLRAERTAEYEAIVNPAREKLAELIVLENDEKTEQFLREADRLIDEIEAAQVEAFISDELTEKYETLVDNEFYASIRGGGEYSCKIVEVKEKLDILVDRENDYRAETEAAERKRERKRKASLISGIATLAFVAVVTLTTLILELGGVIPKMFMAGILPGIEVAYGEGNVAVIEKSETDSEHLVIPSEIRDRWSFKDGEVQAIAEGAFEGNKTVRTVTLPKSLREIGNGALAGCEALQRVTLLGDTPPVIYDNSFGDGKITFYVPADSLGTYLENEAWQKYSDRIFPDLGNDYLHGSALLDGRGVECEDVASFRLDAPLTLGVTPERFGYEFLGWYYLGDDGEERLFEDGVTVFAESVRMYAKWELGEYRVSFNAISPYIFIESKTVTHGSTFGVLPIPVWNGYTFLGWTLDGAPVNEDTVANIGSDVKLVASWSANEYTVTFDYNGGAVGTENRTVVFGSEYGELPVTSMKGYTFLGWYYIDTPVSSDRKCTVFYDHTLTAKFEPITYTVKYNVSGGDEAIPQSNGIYDKDLLYPTPTRLGYTFTCWECDGNRYYPGDTLRNLTDVQGDEVVLVAVWQANSNKIIFDSNGGEGSMDSSLGETDSVITLPQCGFSREGYTFSGWSLTADGAPVYTGGASYAVGTAAETVLYAVWTPNSYGVTLTYYLDGAVIDTVRLNGTVGGKLSLPVGAFSREGYTLVGWSDTEGGETVYADGAEYTVGTSDAALYAVWKANENKIIFNANGGEGEMSWQTAASDATVQLKANGFTRLGYAFLGWSLTPGGEAVYTDGQEYTMGTDATVNLYAVWSVETYYIGYWTNGGVSNNLNPNSYTVESDEIVLLAPTREGYTFLGWCSDEALTTVVTSIPKGTTGHLPFYAKWVANSNTLHFNACGGEGVMDSVKIDTDATYTLPLNKFTRKGYTFIGWKISADEEKGASIGDGGLYTMGHESEYTLYAVWEKNTYTVSYELYGGANSSENPVSYDVESDAIALLAPTRQGYTFLGWYTDSSFTHRVEEIAAGSTGNLTLYSKWTANVGTVTFFPACDEGGTPYEIESQSDATVTLPESRFTRRGYTFIGWTTDASLGVQYHAGDSFTLGTAGAYVMFAVWEKNTYYISYDALGGENSAQNPTSYNIESDTITLASPERPGYTFLGWCTDSSLTGVITEIPTGSVGNYTLYAKWEANTATVYFNAGGGEGAMSAVKGHTGSVILLPDVAFSKEGYRFAGWSLSAGGAAVWSDNAAYTMTAAPETTLYAVWSKTAFTVQYNLGGGTNSTANPSGYNSEGATIALYPASRTGHTFLGWYTDADFTSELSEIATGSSGDIVLYAKWQRNSYTVSLDYNGITATPEYITVTYGEEYGNMPNPYREGHTFLGWYYGDAIVSGTDTVIIADNHKLVAKWSVNSYTVSFNLNGGSGSATPRDVKYGSAYGELPAPTRTGYNFVGWSYSSQPVTADTVMSVASSHVLVAQWEAKKITVTFDYGLGSGSVTSITLSYGDKYGAMGGLPVAYSLGHGYSWSYNNSTITNDTVVSVEHDHTLTARYSVNYYYVYINESNTDVTVIRTDTGEEVASGTKIPYATPLSISVSANEGYQNAYFDIDNTTYTNTLTCIMGAGNLTVNSGADKIPEPEPDNPSCLAKGTMILLPDGSVAPIESLKVGDEILAFNHMTGELEVARIAFTYYNVGMTESLTVTFSGGVCLEVMNTGHGLYNLTLDRYVLLSPDSIENYIGHEFLYISYENGEAVCSSVTLLDATVSVVLKERYDIVTEMHLNHIAEGILATSDLLVGISNTFDFTDGLWNAESVESDIAEHGLFTYEEWQEHVSREEFEAYSGAYFKVALGKGLVTLDEIFALINELR